MLVFGVVPHAIPIVGMILINQIVQDTERSIVALTEGAKHTTCN